MFGGSSSSVIKNNRDLLKNNKREKFVYKKSIQNKVEKEKFDHLILNTEYCQNISKKLKKENRIRRIKQVVFLTLIMILLISILYYYA
ncbi:MAG TPA: hypothetical protein EYO76_10570 [Flavobacteriaceae bacterium]|nr:hypothetical protein [Flavobacteriaceae bacterium]